jgi:hypothetical protein
MVEVSVDYKVRAVFGKVHLVDQQVRMFDDLLVNLGEANVVKQ